MKSNVDVTIEKLCRDHSLPDAKWLIAGVVNNVENSNGESPRATRVDQVSGGSGSGRWGAESANWRRPRSESGNLIEIPYG